MVYNALILMIQNFTWLQLEIPTSVPSRKYLELLNLKVEEIAIFVTALKAPQSTPTITTTVYTF